MPQNQIHKCFQCVSSDIKCFVAYLHNGVMLGVINYICYVDAARRPVCKHSWEIQIGILSIFPAWSYM